MASDTMTQLVIPGALVMVSTPDRGVPVASMADWHDALLNAKSGVTPAMKLVAFTICTHSEPAVHPAPAGSYITSPGLALLCEQTNYSRTHVQRQLSALRAHGWLVTIHRPAAGRSARYLLSVPEAVARTGGYRLAGADTEPGGRTVGDGPAADRTGVASAAPTVSSVDAADTAEPSQGPRGIAAVPVGRGSGCLTAASLERPALIRRRKRATYGAGARGVLRIRRKPRTLPPSVVTDMHAMPTSMNPIGTGPATHDTHAEAGTEAGYDERAMAVGETPYVPFGPVVGTAGPVRAEAGTGAAQGSFGAHLQAVASASTLAGPTAEDSSQPEPPPFWTQPDVGTPAAEPASARDVPAGPEAAQPAPEPEPTPEPEPEPEPELDPETAELWTAAGQVIDTLANLLRGPAEDFAVLRQQVFDALSDGTWAPVELATHLVNFVATGVWVNGDGVVDNIRWRMDRLPRGVTECSCRSCLGWQSNPERPARPAPRSAGAQLGPVTAVTTAATRKPTAPPATPPGGAVEPVQPEPVKPAAAKPPPPKPPPAKPSPSPSAPPPDLAAIAAAAAAGAQEARDRRELRDKKEAREKQEAQDLEEAKLQAAATGIAEIMADAVQPDAVQPDGAGPGPEDEAAVTEQTTGP